MLRRLRVPSRPTSTATGSSTRSRFPSFRPPFTTSPTIPITATAPSTPRYPVSSVIPQLNSRWVEQGPNLPGVNKYLPIRDTTIASTSPDTSAQSLRSWFDTDAGRTAAKARSLLQSFETEHTQSHFTEDIRKRYTDLENSIRRVQNTRSTAPARSEVQRTKTALDHLRDELVREGWERSCVDGPGGGTKGWTAKDVDSLATTCKTASTMLDSVISSLP
jgi:hypothetical protein